MPSSASRQNLSLPSFVFRSRSHHDLRSSEQNSSILYNAAAHSATEVALSPIREESNDLRTDHESDSAITALPSPSRLPRRKTNFWARSSSPGRSERPTILKKPVPAVTDTVVTSTADSETTHPRDKSSKAAWARITSTLKIPFRRLKFGKGAKSSGKKPGLVISAPSNFQHLTTGSGEPLRQAGGPSTLERREEEVEVEVEVEVEEADSDWESVDE